MDMCLNLWEVFFIFFFFWLCVLSWFHLRLSFGFGGRFLFIRFRLLWFCGAFILLNWRRPLFWLSSTLVWLFCRLLTRSLFLTHSRTLLLASGCFLVLHFLYNHLVVLFLLFCLIILFFRMVFDVFFGFFYFSTRNNFKLVLYIFLLNLKDSL